MPTHRFRRFYCSRFCWSSTPPQSSAPEASNAKELTALLKAAACIEGTFQAAGVARGPFLAAFIRASYDTSLRVSDLLAWRWADLSANGRLAGIHCKTGRRYWVRLQPKTLAALEAIRAPKRERIFGGVLSGLELRLQLRRLAEAVAIERSNRDVRHTGSKREGGAS